jgi:hypothetical protein
MKKNTLPSRTETKPAKTLFGMQADQLKAVHGGTGAVGNIVQNVSEKTGG